MILTLPIFSFHVNQICLQLAVLATYVGDEFLALYHCIRSLAVKEPFPEAQNNLILLLERVKLNVLQLLCFFCPFNIYQYFTSEFSSCFL